MMEKNLDMSEAGIACYHTRERANAGCADSRLGS
jgi:hypothetical protein